MLKVYGYSDDLVAIESGEYKQGAEYDCFERDVLITFEDGTMIRVGYPKRGVACWWIEVVKRGTAKQSLTICNDPDAEIYSDVFEIDSEVKCGRICKQKHEKGREE